MAAADARPDAESVGRSDPVMSTSFLTRTLEYARCVQAIETTAES
jgi:hypothetical protein